MNFFRNSLRKKKKGFTLIELIIVIAIIAVLVGLAIPRFLTIQRNSKIKTDIANGKTVCNAVSALIAQDKLDINNVIEIKLDNPNDSDKSKDENKEALKSYLQTIPEPKLDNKDNEIYFKVKITKIIKRTETGSTSDPYINKIDQDKPYDIKVYVSNGTESQDKEVYPNSKTYGEVELTK